MTDVTVPAEAPVIVDRVEGGWLRSHTGYLVTLGLIFKIMIDYTALYSSWQMSTCRNHIIGVIVIAPFIVTAIVITPSTLGRKNAAALLFSLAAGASILSGLTEFSYYHQPLFGVPYVVAGLFGLAGWLVLTHRPPATFWLLIPLAIFTYAWGVNHWVAERKGGWLLNLGLPVPYGESGSFTGFLYGLWAHLNLFLAVAVAAVAGRIAASRPADADHSGYAAGLGADGLPPAAAPMPAVAGQAPTNGAAIASLVCGIVGMFLFFPAAVPAVICGHVARSRIRRTGENGAGLALAGLILGYIGLLILAAVVIAIIALVAATSHSTTY